MHGPGDVEVTLPGWRDLELDCALPDSPWPDHHRCNTGVPHLVIPVADVDAVDLAAWGPRLRQRDPVRARRHQRQLGVARTATAGQWLLRTYERGRGGRDPGLRHWRLGARRWYCATWNRRSARSPCAPAAAIC